jgi:hypothetical protein
MTKGMLLVKWFTADFECDHRGIIATKSQALSMPSAKTASELPNDQPKFHGHQDRIDPEANGDNAVRHPESFVSIHGFPSYEPLMNQSVTFRMNQSFSSDESIIGIFLRLFLPDLATPFSFSFARYRYLNYLIKLLFYFLFRFGNLALNDFLAALVVPLRFAITAPC